MVVAEIYRPLNLNQAPILYTARRTAELIKYAANAFLATKITFINEIADLCEKVGADVQEVARGIGLDNRIGSKFLHAGPGIWRLLLSQGCARPDQDGAGSRSAACAFSRPSLRSTRRESAQWPARCRPCFPAALRGKTIAVLGLTFKPNTDDMREAPSLALITRLAGHGCAGARLRPGGHDAGASSA